MNSPRSTKILALAGCLSLVLVCCAGGAAIETASLRKSHPWGRFRPGSWKRVRLQTETFDADGKVTSTSLARTRTTLAGAGDEGLRLRVESTIDLAGKQVESEPQLVTQGWHGEASDREVAVTELGDDSVTIAGNRISCRVEQVETPAASGRLVTKTWYSERVSPYVLRRESTTYDRESGDVISRTDVEVVALSRSMRVLRQRRQAAEMRVVHTHAAGTIRTRLWSSLEIPGGVVAQESEEFDDAGKLVRRSKLDLIGYAGEFLPVVR